MKEMKVFKSAAAVEVAKEARFGRIVRYDASQPLLDAEFAGEARGVLFIPRAFNEALVYWERIAGKWLVVGLEVCVAHWMTKTKKERQKELKARYGTFLPAGEEGELEFVYVVREKMDDQTQPMTPKSLGLDWEGSTVVDGVKVQFLRFRDVHVELAFIDEMDEEAGQPTDL